MRVTIKLLTASYQVNISEPLSLAIPVEFISNSKSQAAQQPNHFSANFATSNPMQAGGFIGDTSQGGSCNVNELTINPHCNGTHTETMAHICDANHELSKTIADINPAPLMPCVVVSVSPTQVNEISEISDRYTPALATGDQLITRSALERLITSYSDEQCQCLVVRTLPNHKAKCSQVYTQDNQPAFFSREAILYLNERGVAHLLLDLPSLDRLHDEGLLTCHHLFWQVEEGKHQANNNSLVNKTITEMAFIDNQISDGFYFINLQIPAFINDAAPSKPVIYSCHKINV